MHIRLRRWLQSSRQFYVTLIIALLLLLAVLAVFQQEIIARHKRFTYGVSEAIGYNVGQQMQLHLSDWTNELFNPHVAALRSIVAAWHSDEELRARLAVLETLPGVRAAYALEDGKRVVTAHGDGSTALAVELAADRAAFSGYSIGPKDRYERKYEDWQRNRVQYHRAAVEGDSLYLLECAFDSTGLPQTRIPGADADPARVQHLLALSIDRNWIRTALPAHLDSVLYNREALLLWSAPAWKPPQQWYGLGVTGFGDTLWWSGIRHVTRGFPGNDYCQGSHWFHYSVLWQVEAADTALAEQALGELRERVVLSDYAIAAILLLLIAMLILTRRQWLARQTALTHLAHAIRTPAARLRLDVDTLREQRSISPEEEAALVQSIGNECGRIERAVQNAALSLNGNGHTLERIPADLAQLVSEALRPWQSPFAAAGVALSAPEHAGSLVGRFDREMMVTLLDNLLDNALRHTRIQQQKSPRAAQKVAVGLRAEQGSAVLTVDDSDGGVPVADRERIFRRFERGSDDALTGASGLGLGLALVKEIAEAHGGRVRVDDSPLGGARFSVSLPLDESVLPERSARGAHSDHRG